MFIAPKFSLKSVEIDGIKVILNGEEAKDIKRKYPSAKVKNLRRGRSLRADQKPGVCVVIKGEDYGRK